MKRKICTPLIAGLVIIGAIASVSCVGRGRPAHAQSTKPHNSYFAYVGTYTETTQRKPPVTGSKGIYLFRFDANTAHFTPVGLAAEMVNPTFLAVDPHHRFLYAVNEVGDLHGVNGSISSFAINPTNGSLKFLNNVSAEGGNPAHLVVDHTDKMLIVANYISGSVISYALNPDGSIGKRTGFDQHPQPNAPSKKGPHAHAVVISPDNRFFFVPDLGLDRVYIYRLEPDKATFVPNDPAFVSVNPGLGPRHFALGAGAKFAYLVCETGSSAVAFSYDHSNGSLKVIQTISTLPPDFSGKDASAEIQVDRSGRFLYTSNRGSDSITLFGISAKDGTLTQLQVTPTQGEIPRHFAIDPTGKYLVAENQNSDTMVIFKIDQNTGKLTPTGDVVKTPAPVDILFVPTR